MASRAALIRARTRLTAPAVRPDLRLHLAHPGSRLSALTQNGAPPYWAYLWAGGAALALHLQANPGLVAGRRVLDLGAGGGLVALAACRAGAGAVTAVDIDPYAATAIALNARHNAMTVAVVDRDILDAPIPPVDVLTVGDLFYEAALAARVLRFLQRCAAGGIAVWIGDPGRAPLPVPHLAAVATYRVPDFGTTDQAGLGAVYTLAPDPVLPRLPMSAPLRPSTPG